MNPSYHQLNQYTHYLESQVQKFTAFMVTQKILNDKHLLLEHSMQHLSSKINQANQKIQLIQLNQKDNLYQLKKIVTENSILKTMELRLQNIERQLTSILKIDSNNSLDYPSEPSSDQKINSEHKSHKHKKIQKNHQVQLTHSNFQEKDLPHIEKSLSSIYVKKQDFEFIVNKTKDDLDFRIKKLQIQLDKSKESFLKLASHINLLSANHFHQNPNRKQTKYDNRLFTESTKDLNTESLNQQNIVTKKQLRKMEKKLQNFFSQKLSQMTSKSHKKQPQFQGLAVQKALKFKKMQQKYDRMTLQNSNPRQTRSERKIDLSDRQYSSQKKISLFDNEILKERHLNEISQNERKKRKSKSRSNKESPIGILDLQKYGKEKKNSNSQSHVKKIGKKRSVQRLKKVNVDYMMQ